MNRRTFLKTTVAGGAAISATAIATTLALTETGMFAPLAAPPSVPGRMPTTQQNGRDRVTHLINRLTFGVTPELHDYVSAMGIEAYLEEQLSPETIDDSTTDRRLVQFPLIQESGGVLAQNETPRQQVATQLLGATLTRAVQSRRQLYERMVQFWGDHFYIYIRSDGVAIYLKGDDDRDAIRPHALTTFREILGASAHSPAMLVYLDNAASRAEAPNENYARELMELHTLGVNGGYTESDVKAVARAFTGWSVGNPRQGGEAGKFIFRQAIHDREAKVVLGKTLSARQGIEDGETVLDTLAAHPATAVFIATKLVRRFVADNPPSALVKRCAATFAHTQGDIKAVLRTIFTSDEFWNAPPRLKRPFEYTVSLMRALDYQVNEARPFYRTLTEGLEAMGHIPFAWPAPNGYPDVGAYWAGNLLPRWNTAIALVQGTNGGAPNTASIETILNRANASQTLTDFVQAVGHYFYGRALTPAEIETVARFAEENARSLNTQRTAALTLLVAVPAFQYF